MYSISVVTYNILSSKYGNKQTFPKCPKEYIIPDHRINQIIMDLRDMISDKFIILLQEVCYEFRSKLEVLFSKYDYTFIATNYGHPGSGYMGVGIAFPNYLKVERCQFERLGDTYAKCDLVIGDEFYNTVTYMQDIWWRLGLSENPYARVNNHYDNVLRKSNNIQILLELSRDDVSFVVSTYHAPCKFWDQKVMLMVNILTVRNLQQFSGELPYIFGGDFNNKPDNDFYKIVTGIYKCINDTFKDGVSAYPKSILDYFEKNTITPIRSVMFEKHGKEPEFTCWSEIGKRMTEFKDTIDYIFVSEHWIIVDASLSPDITGSVPSSEHSSDHLKLSTTLYSQ